MVVVSTPVVSKGAGNGRQLSTDAGEISQEIF
jgi:hypothetical protein